MDNKINGIIESLMRGDSWLSYSSLSSFKSSPKDFIDYKLGKKEQTDAMIYGSMVHCLVLEPDDFDKRYFVLDDETICSQIGGAKPRATTKYKDWKENEMQNAGGKVLVELDEFKHAQVISLHVRSNAASNKVLKMAQEREKPIEWEYLNFKFKGFIDGHGEKAIFDLKTCADASPKKFQRDLVNFGYYLQAAMYLYGTRENKPYYIIAVDKKGGISVHQLHEQLIEQGLAEYAFLLEKFNECILTESFHKSHDFWSGRYDGIYVAEKPNYMY